MIKNNDNIQRTLGRIIKQVQLVKDDFKFNDKTSKEFMLGRLEKAKNDIDLLIDYVKIEKEKK